MKNWEYTERLNLHNVLGYKERGQAIPTACFKKQMQSWPKKS